MGDFGTSEDMDTPDRPVRVPLDPVAPIDGREDYVTHVKVNGDDGSRVAPLCDTDTVLHAVVRPRMPDEQCVHDDSNFTDYGCATRADRHFHTGRTRDNDSTVISGWAAPGHEVQHSNPAIAPSDDVGTGPELHVAPRHMLGRYSGGHPGPRTRSVRCHRHGCCPQPSMAVSLQTTAQACQHCRTVMRMIWWLHMPR